MEEAHAVDSGPSSHAVELEYLPDDVLIAILSILAKGGARNLAPVASVSKRLHSLCGAPALWEAPTFLHSDPPAYFVAACKRFGRHFRRLCISGLAHLSGPDASKGLSYCTNLSHLNISSFLGVKKGVRFDDDTHMQEMWTMCPTLSIHPLPYVWKRLPRMPNLVHLNASDVAITAGCLASALKSCGDKLTKLYLNNTFIFHPSAGWFQRRPVGTTPCAQHNFPSLVPASKPCTCVHAASILHAFAGVELPRLEELDLSRTICDEQNLLAFLASLPSLRELFLVKPRQEPEPPPIASWSWEHSWKNQRNLDHWSGKNLANALQARGVSVIRKDFLNLMKKMIDAISLGSNFEAIHAKAIALLPVVRRCAGIDARLQDGSTLFLAAMYSGHFAAAQRLVEEFGADPLARCRPAYFRGQDDPWTPPYPASSSAITTAEIANFLDDDIQAFAQGEAPGITIKPGASVLHLFALSSYACGIRAAADCEAVDKALISQLPEMLRNWGAARVVNEPSWDAHHAPPMNAFFESEQAHPIFWNLLSKSICPHALLLELGADQSLTDARGRTVLHAAASSSSTSGRADTVRRILAALPDIINARDVDGCTALLLAIRRFGAFGNPDGDLELIRAILEQENPRADATIAAFNARGFSPLHEAAGRKLGDPASKWRGDDPKRAKLVELLLARPEVDVNAMDEEGRTPLYVAAFSGGVKTVEALLAAPGVDVNAGRRGATPLYGACMLHNVDAVRGLLEAGADPSARPPGHVSPIMRLFKELEIAPATSTGRLRPCAQVDDGYLIDKSRLMYESRVLSRSILKDMRQLFKSKGAVIERADTNGKSALHLAAALQGPDPFAALEEEEDDIAARNARDPTGRTPLMAACEAGHLDAVYAFVNFSDPLLADVDGNTALHVALGPSGAGKADRIKIASLLARAHGRTQAAKARNLEGRTPLHILAASAWREGVAYGRLGAVLAPHSDLTARDLLGRTPLHILGRLSGRELHVAPSVSAAGRVADPTLIVLRSLLQHPQAKEALAVTDNEGCTPLHHAARGGNAEAVEWMLQAGAPAASAREREGRTASEVAPPATRALIHRFLETGEMEGAPSSGSGGGAGGRGRKRAQRSEAEAPTAGEREEGGAEAEAEPAGQPARAAKAKPAPAARRGRRQAAAVAAGESDVSDFEEGGAGPAASGPAAAAAAAVGPRRASQRPSKARGMSFAEEEEQEERGRAAVAADAEAPAPSSSDESTEEQEGEGPKEATAPGRRRRGAAGKPAAGRATRSKGRK
eukprot:tig00021318_g20160.t1